MLLQLYCSCIALVRTALNVLSLPSPLLSERRRYYIARRLSRCHAVCVSAALVSAAKVMRCIQCSLVLSFYYLHQRKVVFNAVCLSVCPLDYSQVMNGCCGEIFGGVGRRQWYSNSLILFARWRHNNANEIKQTSCWRLVSSSNSSYILFLVTSTHLVFMYYFFFVQWRRQVLRTGRACSRA